MAYRTNKRTALTLSIGLLLGSVALAACGDDGEEAPPENTEDAGGKPNTKPDASVADAGKGPGKAGTGAGGRPGGGGGGKGGTGAGGTAAPTDGGVTDGGPTTCDEDDCPGAQCEPFDNEDRIGHPDYVEGEDLPTDFP